MIREHVLDVSDLEPPEPLERALEAVAALPHGELLRVQHRREPYPLYALLEDSGFRHLTRPGRDCPWEILIWHADDVAVAHSLNLTGTDSP